MIHNTETLMYTVYLSQNF